jgi:hypothetical protein
LLSSLSGPVLLKPQIEQACIFSPGYISPLFRGFFVVPLCLYFLVYPLAQPVYQPVAGFIHAAEVNR